MRSPTHRPARGLPLDGASRPEDRLNRHAIPGGNLPRTTAPRQPFAPEPVESASSRVRRLWLELVAYLEENREVRG